MIGQPQFGKRRTTMSINRAPSTGLLWLSIAVAWFVPSSTIAARPSPSLKPNVLIILTDD